MKILSFWGRETNSFASADSCNNGGGYFQPAGGAIVDLDGHPVTVEYADYSCGDFGSRIYYTVAAPHLDMVWKISCGNMDDASLDSPEEVEQIIRSITGCLGVPAWDILNLVETAVCMAAYHMGA